MPDTTLLEIPQVEQDQMLATLRRARYGYLLALHVLLLWAAGRTPTEIAAFLFCSRSSISRIVRLYRTQKLGCSADATGPLLAPVRTTILMPWLQRSLGALLKASPHASGWGRTRWSYATLAAHLQTQHSLEVSAWTVRRWRHEMGWGGKRATLVAQDNDPQRIERLARMRWHAEHVYVHEWLVCADARDIRLLPTVGAAWMPRGRQAEVITPGQNEKHYWAGALTLATSTILPCLGPRQNTAFFQQRLANLRQKDFLRGAETTEISVRLGNYSASHFEDSAFRALLTLLDHPSPARGVQRIDVVVDNYRMHTAKAVEQWFAVQLRFVLLGLPTYCPCADPIERAFGNGHDKGTRSHKRARLRDLVGEVV